MRKRINVKGALRIYLSWPIILSLLLILMNIAIYMVNSDAGILMLGFLLFYIAIAVVILLKRTTITGELVRFAADYGQVQKQLLKEMAFPYAILDNEGKMLWGNDEFQDILGNQRLTQKPVSSIFPEIKDSMLPKNMQDQTIKIVRNEKTYNAILRRIVAPDFTEDESWVFQDEDSVLNDTNSLIAIYL
jgi:c-di-AMP phosphodiesterase-like protein